MEETNPKEILAEEPIEKEVQPKVTKTYNEQIKIPTSSRYLFTLRIILLIFTCVFIPMYSIISPRLDNIEQTVQQAQGREECSFRSRNAFSDNRNSQWPDL